MKTHVQRCHLIEITLQPITTKKSTKDMILIIDVKISSTSKAFHVLLLIIGSVDTERKQKEPYITTTFIKKTLDFR